MPGIALWSIPGIDPCCMEPWFIGMLPIEPMSIPDIEPWSMPPMPMSAMVRMGRGSIGDRGHHAGPWRERTAGIAAPILGLHKERVGAIGFGLHDDVVGLGDADAKLIHRHRLDIVAVRLHDGHRQAINAHVENA